MIALRRKDFLENWFSKAFVLRKKIKREVISDSNWHKRLTKRIYMIFRERESWISTNESW